MNETVPPVLPARPSTASGAAWFFAGFILPLARPAYYRQAVQRATRVAMVFFLVLGSLLTFLFSAQLLKGLQEARTSIVYAFSTHSFPEITIQNGIANVKGENPFVIIDNDQQFMAIDTTGRYRGIDPTRYQQGMLVTRDTFYLLQSGQRYRSYPLSTLNQVFNQNPILINEQTIMHLWDVISTFILLGGFIFMLFWYLLVRLVYMLLLAAILNLFLSALFQKKDFHTVLVTGVYALVPTLILHYLLTRVGVQFFALQTLTWLVLWILGLVWVYRSAPEHPMHLWHALLGLPLLVMISLDVVFRFPSGGMLVWAFAAATLLVLIGVELMSSSEAPPEPSVVSQ